MLGWSRSRLWYRFGIGARVKYHRQPKLCLHKHGNFCRFWEKLNRNKHLINIQYKTFLWLFCVSHSGYEKYFFIIIFCREWARYSMCYAVSPWALYRGRGAITSMWWSIARDFVKQSDKEHLIKPDWGHYYWLSQHRTILVEILMAVRAQFENSNEIGVFSKLTNTYCLVSIGASENFYRQVACIT
jgi:hypothetical protein